MGTTFKHVTKQWSGDGLSVDDERPRHSVAAEDVFDDPSILRELNEATASLAVRRNAERGELVPARLPPVDAFDFAAACRADEFEESGSDNDSEEAHRAKSLAHRLGPPGHDRSPKRRWWSFVAARNRREGFDAVEWRNPPSYSNARSGSRRALFWGVCASLSIIIAAPVVFGSFRPSDETAPAPAGDIRNNDQKNASLVDQGAADDDLTVETEVVAELRSNKTVVVRNQPVAAAIIAPATTAFAAPLVRDTTRDIDGEPEPPAAEPKTLAVLEATNLGSSVPAPLRTDNGEPVTPPAPVADRDTEDFTLMAQSQLSATADPSQAEVLEKTSGEIVPAAAEPGLSPLSDEQIDRLLSRGEDLLRNGDIASARLLFLRVAAAGDRRGAKAVGMTYDPNVHVRLPIVGLAADPEQAQFWYGKAGTDLSYTIDLAPAQASAGTAESAEDEALRQWNDACARKYQSFEASTGLYTGRSGTKRRCQLP